MRIYHPDKHPHISTDISQRRSEIYNILSDERSRQIYDCWLCSSPPWHLSFLPYVQSPTLLRVVWWPLDLNVMRGRIPIRWV